MKFPKELKLIFKDKTSKKPIDNIAVRAILHAKEKNDYNVGPYLSNKSGIIIIKRNDLLREIKASKSFFLMDYKSDLEDCSDVITLEILSNENITSFLKDYTEFKDIYKGSWDYSKYFLNKVENCVNRNYFIQPVIVAIDLTKIKKSDSIDIYLTLRRIGQ